MECEVAEAGGFGVAVDSNDAALFAWLFVVIGEGEGRRVLVLLWFGDWVVVVGCGGACYRGGGGFREGFVVEERERGGFGERGGGGGGGSG